jgi:pimeloyl-ACP methyl ester carboxylesterase
MSSDWRPPAGAEVDHALHARVSGRGPAIVLLHGLLGSHLFWGAEYDRLADRHQLIVPDLLGFGHSPHPEQGYDTDAHARAVLQLLDDLEVLGPVGVATHSLGTVIALRMAVLAPDRVRSIIAFGPPLYPNDAVAAQHVVGAGFITRLFINDTWMARRTCRWMCAHRRAAATLAATFRRDLPRVVARATVEHTWASYSETLREVLLCGNGDARVEAMQIPVHLVAGDGDPVVDLAYLRALSERNPQITLEVWPGSHDLPLRQARRCCETVLDRLG